MVPPSIDPCAPRQGLHNGTWIARRRPLRRNRTIPPAVVAAPGSCPGQPHRPRRGRFRDLRRPNVDMRRLCGGVHPLGRRSGVLRPEGLRLRSEALSQLPRQPAGKSRSRLRRPRHRRPPRLRARRRACRPGVLRGRLLIVRKPGAGSVQAAHGSPGLLLRLLPAGQARLTLAWPRRLSGGPNVAARRGVPRSRPCPDARFWSAPGARRISVKCSWSGPSSPRNRSDGRPVTHLAGHGSAAVHGAGLPIGEMAD
jgi:hypothetical protein